MAGGHLLMRRKVKIICLNRLGVKLGSMMITTDTVETDPKIIFEKNRKAIKQLYPATVKVKILEKKN
jgi:hypothetical protein